MKECKDCNTVKPLNEFTKKASCKDGYEPRCKICRSIKYNKSTLELVVKKIYQSQLLNSSKRGHVPPNYTLQELIEWTKRQPNWNTIYKAYVDSNYQKSLAPSIDRLDNNKPYSIGNIQLVDWRTNIKNASRDSKLGLINKNQRAVRAINLDGTLHKEYISISEAVRDIKGRMWGVWSVAEGKPVKNYGNGKYYTPKSYKGYKWEWM